MHHIYKIMFFFSIGLTLAAVVTIAIFGLNFGIDFRGGSIVELEFSSDRPNIPELQNLLKEKLSKPKEINFALVGDRGIILKTGELSEQDHQEILEILRQKYSSPNIEEKKFDSIGPVIGQELRGKSITAIVLVLLAVIIYIAFVFRKMSVVLSPWVMGISAIVALFHDVVIPMGVFAVLGQYYGIEISAVFVAAILTILGYSISDTVVVFDRVRENVIRNRMRDDFGKVVHVSIMQTLTRSLNTTFTTILSLMAIFLFGGDSLKYFALALIIGIFLGAYSSIFVASPLLVWWNKRRTSL